MTLEESYNSLSYTIRQSGGKLSVKAAGDALDPAGVFSRDQRNAMVCDAVKHGQLVRDANGNVCDPFKEFRTR